MKKHIFVLLVESGGDLIQFVQDYFNLGFKDALRKINYDFNLNLNFNSSSRVDFKKIEEQIKFDRLKKEQQKQAHKRKMLKLCNTLRTLEKIREEIKSQINPYNWEEVEKTCALLSEQIELLDLEFEKLNVKRY